MFIQRKHHPVSTLAWLRPHNLAHKSFRGLWIIQRLFYTRTMDVKWLGPRCNCSTSKTRPPTGAGWRVIVCNVKLEWAWASNRWTDDIFDKGTMVWVIFYFSPGRASLAWPKMLSFAEKITNTVKEYLLGGIVEVFTLWWTRQKVVHQDTEKVIYLTFVSFTNTGGNDSFHGVMNWILKSEGVNMGDCRQVWLTHEISRVDGALSNLFLKSSWRVDPLPIQT